MPLFTGLFNDLPPQFGNICATNRELFHFKFLNLDKFSSFSTNYEECSNLSPTLYGSKKLLFWNLWKSCLCRRFKLSPPHNRYFPHIRVKHLWNKKGTFSTFLTKMAYLYPSYPCLSLLPVPCNPRHRCIWDCSQRCSCHMLQPYSAPHTDG